MRDFDSIGKREMGTIENRVRHIYNRGYEDGYKDGRENIIDTYDAGSNDAWECAGRIANDPCYGGLTSVELKEIFGSRFASEIMRDNTASEAIAKIKAWEEKKKQDKDEIKVGDQVYSDAFDDMGIVTYITADKVNSVCVICNGSTMMKVGTHGLHKTGRHFPEIAEVLKKMREVEE